MEKFKNFFAGTNRRLRITTAIIMLSLAYFIVKIGYWGVCSLGLVLALAMIYEFDKMFNKKNIIIPSFKVFKQTDVIKLYKYHRT